MPDWRPELLLLHPREVWAADATHMGFTAGELRALSWSRAFTDMEALEQGGLANVDESRQVGHYWLRAPESAPTMGQARAIGETQEAIRKFAWEVHSGAITAEDGQPFGQILHIGIGGSALGPALLIDALVDDGRGMPIAFLDNTDPDGIARILAALEHKLQHTLVLVVSKSGGTAETRNAMHLVQHALRARELDPGKRMVAITLDGSKLDALAQEQGWLRRFHIWDWVGGRTSVTSAVGLLPAELCGVDTHALLEGARKMDEWTRVPDPLANPAALLAGSWYLAGHGRGERAMVVLPYADRLLLLSRYLQQLVMESLGKELDLHGDTVHQGLTVYGNKGSTDQHAFVQQLRDGRDDFFALFVQVASDGDGAAIDLEPGIRAGDYLQGFLLGTRRALAERGRPTFTLTVPRVDAEVLGGLIALFERAVGLYASLIRINAYHQPGVEAGKKAAAAVLALSTRLRAALDEAPRDLGALAAHLDAEPAEVWYVVQHLAATGRVIGEDDGTWRLPRGAETGA